MKYLQIMITIIATLLLIITYKFLKNPYEMNLVKIGGAGISWATPINVRIR